MGTKINYPPEIPFKIDNMKFDITLEFNEDKVILGKELISLTALDDFNQFELNIGKNIKMIIVYQQEIIFYLLMHQHFLDL